LTALVGPSGSGKSTLLNLIGCLDRPTAGTLEVDGQDISPFSRTAAAQFRLERLGFVFQAYNLLPVLTAYENAEYTLLLRGLNPRERREIVEPLMERVGLADMMNRRPHELSGGQQQRVAVVRALAAKPCLILADEPTANLDTATTGGMLDLLVELNENDGMTFLLASHDKRVVERARRVVHLEDGLICADERRDS
jgi:putative ABC transport system ATP-binding protein